MTAGAPLRVLYVEDDRVCALLMDQALAALPGIDLQVAETGAEATALVDGGWQPQVLVIDAHLPDTTGHALLAALRQRPGLQTAPAYMCSADSRPADLQHAADAGFAGYWEKPVSAASVQAALRVHLALRP